MHSDLNVDLTVSFVVIFSKVNKTRSQAVARIADRTASQHRCLPDSPKPDSPKLGFRVRVSVRVYG